MAKQTIIKSIENNGESHFNIFSKIIEEACDKKHLDESLKKSILHVAEDLFDAEFKRGTLFAIKLIKSVRN